ncbi:MAG: hypothetical protein QF393_05040, partial [Rhodospirillales bacterium]|nr:hypothetical protein [Rhodospirillales bacterium]
GRGQLKHPFAGAVSLTTENRNSNILESWSGSPAIASPYLPLDRNIFLFEFRPLATARKKKGRFRFEPEPPDDLTMVSPISGFKRPESR